MGLQTLTELATTILEDAKRIDEYIAVNELRPLSLGVDQPPNLPFFEENPSLDSARGRLLETIEDLSRLVLGPAAHLRKIGWLYGDSLSLQAVTHWKVHDAIPLHEERSFADISKSTGLPEDYGRRLLRHAMTNKIFHEPKPGFVAHTAASAALVKDPALCDFITLQGEENGPSSSGVVKAIDTFGESDEPNHAGFNAMFNTTSPFYVWMANDPPRAARFGRGLGSGSGALGYGPEGLFSYPWDKLSNSTVVDVGGSHGSITMAVATVFPNLKVIVQDRPEIIDAARADIPEFFKDRFEFQAHDFFEPQPVVGAGAYFFRWIFHNWSDTYCVRILKALVPAMRSGSKVLLHDSVLPEPGTASWGYERYVRHMDLIMMSLFNSKLRSLDDWKTLFAAADSRFAFKGATVPEGSNMAIIEAVWDEELRETVVSENEQEKLTAQRGSLEKDVAQDNAVIKTAAVQEGVRQGMQEAPAKETFGQDAVEEGGETITEEAGKAKREKEAAEESLVGDSTGEEVKGSQSVEEETVREEKTAKEELESGEVAEEQVGEIEEPREEKEPVVGENVVGENVVGGRTTGSEEITEGANATVEEGTATTGEDTAKGEVAARNEDGVIGGDEAVEKEAVVPASQVPAASEETEVKTEVAAREEPVAGQKAVAEEAPNVEEVPAAEEVTQTQEVPKIEETPEVESAPAVEEVLKVEEAPKAEREPAAKEAEVGGKETAQEQLAVKESAVAEVKPEVKTEVVAGKEAAAGEEAVVKQEPSAEKDASIGKDSTTEEPAGVGSERAIGEEVTAKEEAVATESDLVVPKVE